jgi:hypothetical protein
MFWARSGAEAGHRTRNAAIGRHPAIGPRTVRRGGRYFTDGVNLYRIDALGNSSGRAFVGLEDCRSFRMVLMAADEFRALRLRPVRSLGPD